MEFQPYESINSLKVLIKNSGKIKCSDISPVILNFIFWLCLLLIIINYLEGFGSKNNGILYFSLIFGVISYIYYIYHEFHSTTFAYLRTKDDKIIKEKIGDFFQSKPSLYLHIQCYHYERKCPNRGEEERSIVYTYNKKSEYHYKFWRDISGKIILDINRCRYKYKYYAILKVIQEIIFIDAETLDSYNSFEENFLRLNKNRDALYNFSEYIEIEGIKDINIIKLSEKEPCSIGCFPFIIFTFLSLGTLYKLYIRLISIEQTIIIRKIISNRNEIIDNPIYNRYKPKFQYFDEIIKYGQYKNFQSNNNAPI